MKCRAFILDYSYFYLIFSLGYDVILMDGQIHRARDTLAFFDWQESCLLITVPFKILRPEPKHLLATNGGAIRDLL